jgi:hypothetical protein
VNIEMLMEAMMEHVWRYALRGHDYASWEAKLISYGDIL